VFYAQLRVFYAKLHVFYAQLCLFYAKLRLFYTPLLSVVLLSHHTYDMAITTEANRTSGSE
jgi:hypothetical protein